MRRIVLFFGLLNVALASGVAQASNFTVSSLADSGMNTLRDVITQANGATGPHNIGFSVTGTIALQSALPAVTQAVNIDGDTNNDGVPDITLDGDLAGNSSNGLVIRGGNSTIRGLKIVNFKAIGMILAQLGGNTVVGNLLGDGAGGGANDQGELLIDEVPDNQIGGTDALDRNVMGANNHQSSCSIMVVDGPSATGNTIQGNYIGVTADGESESSNCIESLLVQEAPNTLIGGDVAGAGNVLSGSLRGLFLTNDADQNTVQGNLIGTDKDGLQEIGNDEGILLQGNDNLIGGTTPLARNVISGNENFNATSGTGIMFGGSFIGVRGNIVQGNLIGTDITGTAALPNHTTGIQVQDCNDNIIGGTTAAERNIISGNIGDGVTIVSTDSHDNLLEGNYIGLDISGAALPNDVGVTITSNAHDNTVGGTVFGAGNVISGNNQQGVEITDTAGAGNKIQGNFIGTDPTGTSAIPNGSDGISSRSLVANAIGGSDPGAGNVVSGNLINGIDLILGANTLVEGNFVGTDLSGTNALPNTVSGIAVVNSDNNTVRNNLLSGNTRSGLEITDGANNNQVFGNKIGTDTSGTLSLPNGLDGVRFIFADNNFVGGNNPGEGNIIAFNVLNGVFVSNSLGNRIWGNSIFENDQLGISLDSGTGNLGQPAPTLSEARIAGMQLNVLGTLNAAPNTVYTLQFFSNAALDPTGGEGQVFLGEATTTTGGAGTAAFDVDVDMMVPTQFNLITATATDPNGNTSEFSKGVTAIMVGSVQFSAGVYSVDKDAGTMTILVTRSGGSEGDIKVDFATSDGTCVAGQDYQSVAQTLDFPAGVVSVEVTVPILDNPDNAEQCLVQLSLSNPQGGTVLGAPAEAILQIIGSATAPVVIQGGGCALARPNEPASAAQGLWILGLAFLLAWRRRTRPF